MPQRIEFTIPGIPKPGGSKTGFVLRRGGRIVTRPNGAPVVIMKEASDNADWKQNCAFFARQTFRDDPPLRGPLEVHVTFIMPRPGNHFGSGRNTDVLKTSAPSWHVNTPDATKLMRSTEDALTGIAWADDKQIARQFVQKVYGDKPGARVVIIELTNEEAVRDVPAPLFESVA